MEMMDVFEEKADGFGSDTFIIRKGWPLINQCLSFLFNPFRAGSSRLPNLGH
jgi:hypothetical protein